MFFCLVFNHNLKMFTHSFSRTPEQTAPFDNVSFLQFALPPKARVPSNFSWAVLGGVQRFIRAALQPCHPINVKASSLRTQAVPQQVSYVARAVGQRSSPAIQSRSKTFWGT